MSHFHVLYMTEKLNYDECFKKILKRETLVIELVLIDTKLSKLCLL